MGYNYKAEERKRYLKYFMVWMILAGIAVVAFFILLLTHKKDEDNQIVRNNNKAPSQRVYDYADVLTDSEEKDLERKIADWEEMGKCDLVLVTINKDFGATSDDEWNYAMVNLADDFYDQNAFGYEEPHGNGAILVDNWYHAGKPDSQAGAWLSTSGALEYEIGEYEEDNVWRAFDDGLESSAAEAYTKALKKVAQYSQSATDSDGGVPQIPWAVVVVIPVVVALIYAFSNMKQSPGKDTTSATTYVPGGKPAMKNQRDDYLRKTVSKVKIETSSSSRGGGGGSYGHHTSSGGFSHGGGGHRR